MDPAFNQLQTSPWNEIFNVIFFPDRIYHAQYLNASISQRYRYNVQEVRSYVDINVLKGEVYLDGEFYSNFLRVEYRGNRLREVVRDRFKQLQNKLICWIKLLPADQGKSAEARLKLHYCPNIGAYQAEIWETLENRPTSRHDLEVLMQMGAQSPITRIPSFNPALREIKSLSKVELAFRENDIDLPSGYVVSEQDAAWDNGYMRSHQEPRTSDPSSDLNTIKDQNYLIAFQRGWFLDVSAIEPVRYRNAMMDVVNDNGTMIYDNPDADPDNIIEMRWIVQRELGGSMVFFHEVTIPVGKVEGTHQHVGTEELYYITEGEGIAYMRVGDDPATDSFPTVQRKVMGLGMKDFKELPVKSGRVIFTKSGGMHGIRNTGSVPLKFVAFLYHTA